MVHDLTTVIICDGKVPTDRQQSFFVCLYKKDNFLLLSLGSNQYQARRVYDLCVYFMTEAPKG